MRVTIDLDRHPQDKLRLIETLTDWRAFKAECQARHPDRDVRFQWSLTRPEEFPALLVMGHLHALGNRLTYRFDIIRNVAVEPAPLARTEADTPSPA